MVTKPWCLKCFLYTKPKATIGNIDSIESISRKISCLNSDLNGLCTEGELVVDSHHEQQETIKEQDNDNFGFGNLKIDYKLPLKTTKREMPSTRGGYYVKCCEAGKGTGAPSAWYLHTVICWGNFLSRGMLSNRTLFKMLFKMSLHCILLTFFLLNMTRDQESSRQIAVCKRTFSLLSL